MNNNSLLHRKEIENALKETITELLKNSPGAPHDTLDLNTSFLELGINSVQAVELVEAINQKLGIELGVEVMFDYRDAKELTAFILQHYGKTDRDENPLVLEERQSSDIAVIGLSGRFAGSPNLEAFWSHLQAGESCIEPTRRKGWQTSTNSDPTPVNPSPSKWGGMLEHIDQFDPLFFNISPLEAAKMDPQQRLFLEEAYKTFEDAGYSAEQLSDKRVGVFVGARASDYQEQALHRGCRSGACSLTSRLSEMDSHLFLGNDMAILAARISYFLNCKGPSLTIDTACSSSLVAVHLACESLRTGESEMALAGGVFVLDSPDFHVMTSKINVLSPDGICRTFDNAANGIVIGEGVGAIVLKPLDTALSDGDHIYGIIKGSAINQDGRTKGITAPSMLSQKALLVSLYKKATIHPETISYIEAHGTGTKLGDPIEMKALTEAFHIFTAQTQFCAVGSLKPNIGHTIMSAGIAGLLKILLAMKYQQIPPTINIKEINQQIDFQESPFFINTELREWKSRDGSPRRAGISSFGFSGTNCHVILEEPPLQKKRAQKQTRPYAFFPFSAKTKTALKQKIADMVKWLEKEGETYSAEDISYTLVQGRSHFSMRSAVVARDVNDLLHALRAIMSEGEEPHDVENEKGKPSQTEPALHAYGDWLLKELREKEFFAQKEYKEKLLVLADLYMKGYPLDWGQLFEKGGYHRVPLPTYPFLGDSYWIAETEGQSASLMDTLIHRFQKTNQHIRRELLDAETRQGIQEMEELLYQLLWSQLQSLGLFREKHTVLTLLREQAGISTNYDRWLQESVALLERRHYLHNQDAPATGGHVTCTISDSLTFIESGSLWQSWDQHKVRWLQNANLKARVVLVETTLRALPAVLTGQRPATEIMFPNGSMELVEGIYQHNVIADYFNEILATFVVAYLQEWLTSERDTGIRILEIGAGTGGTTSQVLQVLQPYQASIAEYCYSDVSPAFLRHGQQRYAAGYPYLTYQILNVEKPLAGQGIELGSYDLVIAANVLHATSNIRRTVRNAKAALKKQGLLLLNEITGGGSVTLTTSLFMHLTFGLLSGWWAYEDAELRVPGCPALSAENWETVLSREGFGEIYIPTREAQELGQQVIVAETCEQTWGASPMCEASPPLWQGTDDVARRLPVGAEQGYQSQALDLRTATEATKVPGGADSVESITDPGHEGGQESARRDKPQTLGVVPTDKLYKALSHVVSDLLRVRVEEIDPQTELSEYGFDSITFMEFANRLNQTYSLDLTPPLFYEHSTIERLAQYLHTTYISVLTSHFAGASLHQGNRQMTLEPVTTDETPLIVENPIVTTNPMQQSRVTHSLVPEPQVHPAASSIAIIGISGIFPQAPDVQSLWSNLLAGRNCINEIPASRWDWQTYFGNPATEANKTNVKWAGIVEDVELFDPLFFGISPSEAEQMDPQQRLLMMYVWKAIEDAGYSASSLSGTNTALFVGTTSSGYSERLSRAGVTIEGYSSTGQALSVGPNRMSYFLNLHGPSEAIETACSSSLIAIHRGVNVIESGQCSVAIVGGVNTLVSPELHISYSKAGMLSEDGRCKSFSAEANGYVRGEGVGILVLKKLSEAEQAGDHIYGVIRGSAENHGGRASSLTAPNPRAQANLLIAAYRKAGIDPRTVSYIETHGTGTPLGDPIEINGLKAAFSELAQTIGEGPMPQAWCGIGSLKSNIGHLEWASGVAGVIKVLLQLQHKTLVKSLHCERLNPYIELKGSPFYIVQENREWAALRDSEGNALPRRAGVSSFGFGGANAHVVLEEYVPSMQGTEGEASSPLRNGIVPIDPPCHSGELASPVYPLPLLIVLSAKNEEQLHEQVRQLLTWVRTEIGSGKPLGQTQDRSLTRSLHDLAYTLQVGREAMEERLALHVNSFAELEEKLHRYLQEPQKRGDWYRGQVKQHKETMALFRDDEELQEAIDKWLQRGKYEKLLQGWVKGLTIEWQHLYTVGRGLAPLRSTQGTTIYTVGRGLAPLRSTQGTTIGASTIPTAPALPRRISLPTYPFARERYWIPTPKTESTASGRAITASSPAILHPLVQHNISTLREQRFISTFCGDEFFLADHVVKGQRVLPAVAYLEMVRVAVALAAEMDAQTPLCLHEAVWIQPLVVEEHPLQVSIKLRPHDDGTISYEITSQPEGGNTTEAVIHCQGSAVPDLPAKQPQVDITTLQAQCPHQISTDDCYTTYQAMRIEYGPTFRVLEQISLGSGPPGQAQELLARLRLPSGLVETPQQCNLQIANPMLALTGYVLHPALMDGALQAAVGFLIGTGITGTCGTSPQATGEPILPFAVEEVNILAPCRSIMWAWLRLREDGSHNGKGQKIDIDVFDEHGMVCVQLIGLSFRILEGTPRLRSQSSSTPVNDPLEGMLTLVPAWENIEVTPISSSLVSTTPMTIGGGTAEEQAALQLHFPNSRIIDIQATDPIATLVDKLASQGSIEHLVWIAPPPPEVSLIDEALIAAQNQGVLFCFRTIKALLQLGYGDRKLSWSVITHQAQPIHPEDTVNPTHASIHGLIGSLAKEYPNWSIRLIDLEAHGAWPFSKLFTLPPDSQGNARVYRAHKWYQPVVSVPSSGSRKDIDSRRTPAGKVYTPNPNGSIGNAIGTMPCVCPPRLSLDRSAYRFGGTYVVIGGAGGIGEVWSEYLISKYQAQIIWIGRRKIDAGIEGSLSRLAALGPRPYYVTADATDRPALQQAYEEIKQNFGQIHGVVHSAIVLLDQSLANMDEERFRAALAVKVDVSVRLAQIFGYEPLDFVLFFSSIGTFTKMAGQSNYAAGCTFEDAFAHSWRKTQSQQGWRCAVKTINWGYWGNVGVAASPEYRERMVRTGFGSIEPAEAMETLELLLPSPIDQCALVKTTRTQVIDGAYLAVGASTNKTDEELRKRSTAYLKELVGKVLDLPCTKIHTSEPLVNYGLDSILVLQLTNTLRTDIEQISSTLFFECATIDTLVDHFLHYQKKQLERLVGLSGPTHGHAQVPPLRLISQQDRHTPQRFLTGGQTNSKRDTEGKTKSRKLPLSEEAPAALPREKDIAIIGVVGRYPGAKDVQSFWHLLKTGTNAIREIPAQRWDWRRYLQAEKGVTSETNTPQATHTKWGGFLEDIDCFDASFFHVSPREAEQMDPQERLFLEASYACIEDAGYTPATIQEQGPVGVFVGVMNGNYPTGAKYWSIANRVSFVLGLQGPSVAVDTACSSSLTALHFAVESLMSGTSACAIVGGVNLIVDPVHYLRLSNVGVLSTSDQCKSFGEDADGFVDGEGVGAFLLKPKHRAEADGDHIYGVIKSTAINHGGKTNGYTAPNPDAQAQVIKQALQRAEIDPRTINYVEAHGTGTVLGDPIEIAGLTRAFYSRRGVPLWPPLTRGEFDSQDGRPQGHAPTGWCAIGSVKSNIGHAESAAGIAGVTKVLLQMRYGQLVPSLHAQVLNPLIDFSTTPFVVQQQLSAWKRPQEPKEGANPLPRRAGISSFGAGGSNAHVILEEYVPRHQTNEEKNAHPSRPVIIVLSARTEERLQERVEQLLAWMQERTHAEESLELDRLAYTLQVGREAMEERLAMIVGSQQELEEKLQKYVEGKLGEEHCYRGQVKRYDSIRDFATDEDGQKAIAAWISKGKYEKLLEWWVKGLTIDWNFLYTVGRGLAPLQSPIPTAPTRPQRISLPTYPFARERYWIPNRTSTPVASGTQVGQEQTLSATGRTNENGTPSNRRDESYDSNKVALRPLIDHPQSSAETGANPASPSETPIEADEHSNLPTADPLRQIGLAPIRPTSPRISTPPASALLAASDREQALQLEEELSRSLAQALYMEESAIDVEKPFGDMGVDSVISVEWIQSLNKQYACHLKASSVYDYPTIRQLASFLQAETVGTGLAPVRETTEHHTHIDRDRPATHLHVGTGLAPARETVEHHTHTDRDRSTTHLQTASRAREAIAIVGMSGKYPKARNLSGYWDNLVQGKNAIREVPLSRFDVSDYYDPNPEIAGKIYCKWLGVLDEIEYFDPLFFAISPAEAEVMDPQHRLFLQEGYKAFEDAGYSPQLLNNRKCGVYLGIMSHEYDLLLHEQKASGTSVLGTSHAIAAARIAYLLNLKGPALSIDTACSSSLVATHLACQALSNQEIDMALVGGASLYLTPSSYIGMCNAGMLSPDGQCKAFDTSANGFVPGEGVGALVLKRLADAEADHDQIYGVIIGSGMNQDGTTSGIMAPSVKSQIDLVREIYERYQIDPESISYIEMHGTGTKLGDPIELEALATAFREKTQRKQYCAVGSVKSNIGHTSAAAGVAGVQKVLLAMRQKKLVPTLHFQQPNEHFDFAASPFYVNTQVQDWQSAEGPPRRAAVSSFGFSGTNAHLVIEEYIPEREADENRRDEAGPRPPSLFVLSARSEQQLKSYAQDMYHWIQAHEGLALADIAFTLQLGREALDHRLAIPADSREVLLQRLAEFVENHISTGVYIARSLVQYPPTDRRNEENLTSLPASPDAGHSNRTIPNRSSGFALGARSPGNEATLFEVDEDGQSLLHIWCQKKNLTKLAQIWVKGVNIDWKLLYTIGAALPHRVSLPTYPFARERYWLPHNEDLNPVGTGLAPVRISVGGTLRSVLPLTGGQEQALPLRNLNGIVPRDRPQTTTLPAILHPLVQHNISDFFEQRFSSTFHGDEFFLADHMVKGQRIMPGVAYLEMARAAVAQAMRNTTDEAGHIIPMSLQHIVWPHPLSASTQPVTVHTILEPQDNTTISFLIRREGSCAPPPSHLPPSSAPPPSSRQSWHKGQAHETGSAQDTGQGQALSASIAQIYCQGTALVGPGHKPQNTAQSLDLATLQARCQYPWDRSTGNATEIYQHLRLLGISYGPALQGIEHLSVGEGEVLARIRLPAVIAQTHTDFVLHPSILDAALQACVGLLTEPAKHREPQVPFSLDELEIISEIPAQGWAWARQRSLSATESVFDIEVCDDTGRVVVRLRGLSTRTLLSTDCREGSCAPPSYPPTAVPIINTVTGNRLADHRMCLCMYTAMGNDGGAQDPSLRDALPHQICWSQWGKPRPYDPHSLLYAPRWNPIVLTQTAEDTNNSTTNQVVIVGGTPDEQSAITHAYPHAHVLEIPTGASIEQIAQHLCKCRDSTLHQSSLVPLHLFWLAPHAPQSALTEECILVAQQQGVLACFRLIKALLQLGYGNQRLHWTVITRQACTLHATETGNPTHASLLGLFGSLAKERAHWKIQQVDLPIDAPLPLIEMSRLPADPQGHGWLHRNGHWYRQSLVPLDVSSFEVREAYRRGGVYVVIGGAGGIGEVWSEYLIRRYQAQIIWIGRRKIDTGILAKQERLAALGPVPHYITADATNRSELQQAYQDILYNIGHIHGVVHSAIVLLDQTLANMTEERFQAALAAKVDISVRLAQVFSHEQLDFVLFFSSLGTFARNAGQSNYAAGCTFEDAFAAQLGQDWSCAVKVMNWGYWGSVGVVAEPVYQERMAQMGLGSIEPAEAMQALEALLIGPANQIVLLKTTKPLAPELLPWGEIIQSEGKLRAVRQGMQEIDEWLCQLLWSCLQSLGLFRKKHAVLTHLREQAAISTKYDRWLQESLALLERQHYLRCQENTCTVVDTRPIESETLWSHWDQQKEHWIQNTDLKARVVLAETTLHALPSILTGKRPATEILFPNGSMELVEGIYQHNVIADSFNETLARSLVTYIQERLTQDRSTRFRILEIGAGTGGTTSKVLQMLQPYQASIAEYCYSDVSEAFLLYGQQRYATDYPYLTFQIFNVEKPLTGQGIKSANYDLVIAANVLHATSNIRRALRHAKAALKLHALLLLNEITETSLFTHLTVGLLDGWWAYEDPELRVPGSPALTAESWQAVLSSEGFKAISLPLLPEMQATGQQVIVATKVPVPPDTLAVAAGLPRLPVTHHIPVTQHIPATHHTPSVPHLPVSPHSTITDNTDEVLRQKSIAYLKAMVGKVLNLPSSRIDPTEPLTRYGLDSIRVLQLTQALQTGLEPISSALFFEYATIEALVEHLLHTQKEALHNLLEVSTPSRPEIIHPENYPPAGASLPSPAPTFRPFLTGERGSHKGRDEADRGKPLSLQSSTQRYLDGQGQAPPPGGGIPTHHSVDVGLAPSRPLRSPTSHAQRDIAIIGIAGRYPGARDIQTFWHLLKTGTNAIREIPPQRWDWKRYFQAEKGAVGSIYTKWGGFLEDIDCFDASFFHISPREAEQMDPQERLLLEISYTCIEDAGYTPAALGEQGPVGVFVGVMNGNYPTGARYWSIANRVSFTLGLQGPSMAVDTACSSSLTALHLAVESLMSGTSGCAIVGGVNLIVDPVHYLRLSSIGMLTSSDQCKSFGEDADGFVDGEGVGALLLKPKHRAEADGDHIYGVIKSTAINHGGKTNGYTIPNPDAQAQVIKQALQRAEIDPRTISYVEAHGTGTVLGDPIEIAGLTRAFTAPELTPSDSSHRGVPLTQGDFDSQDGRPQGHAPTGWCAIGSVKSNIGHTESAAGIAGVTKVLLQMRYRQLVPSLHAQVLNPHIDFNATPFVVQQQLSPWKRPQGEGANPLPRRAAISSFGAGGSNAHVILEEYVPEHQTNETRNTHPSCPLIIVLSARTEEQLQERAQQLLAWIASGAGPCACPICGKEPGIAIGTGPCTCPTCDGEPIQQTQDHSHALSLQNLAYTLQVGRETMEERLAMLADSLAELEEKLRRYSEGEHEGTDWYRGHVKQHEAIGLFAADEDGQKAIAAWISKGKYGKLLELWVKGATIDWSLLYTAGAGQAQGPAPTQPQRISLPTYPFARERYWTHAVGTGLAPLAPTHSPENAQKPGRSPVGTGQAQGTVPTAPVQEMVEHVYRTERDRPATLFRTGANPHRVALRPLTEHAGLSRNGADQPELSISPSLSDQTIPQSGSEMKTETDERPAMAETGITSATPLSPIDPVRMPVAQGSHAERGQALSTVAELEEELARSLAKALYMEQSNIDREIPFVDMGLDSVIGVEWVQSINKQYTSNLTVSSVYDYPTICQLAGFLQKELLKHGGGIQQTPVQSLPTLDYSRKVGGTEGEAAPIDKPCRSGGLAPPSVNAKHDPHVKPVPSRSLRQTEAIAIIGMSGKYPDAKNLTDFWDNLVQAKNAIREIPLSRFDISDRYDPDPEALGKISCKWLGALEDIEYFDSLFFHISPAEAAGMDPQHRLFLEEGYKALEDAGYSPQLLNNKKCGVYLGIIGHEYSLLLSQQKAGEMNLFGTSPAIAAARLAYLLNLKGPAIPIDTACSSSLVATHLACQALRSQEIDMALVGGVNLSLTSDFYVSMCGAGMLSPSGQCKTFDASANGFVPGEGVGAVVLKRLADAEADHDQIYGLIIGSGINQDGATNGIMAPSVKSQVELEREIYRKYAIDPASISYVETHGTGTKLGDPIELQALATVFQERTKRKQYCAIGSVKTNIGHTMAAAGMASVQKVLLAMQQKKLVPTLHFQQPNEYFDFAASPFYVNTKVQDWPASEDTPRRAAVSSFGFTGTNAHLVIEEYIPRWDGACPRPHPYGPHTPLGSAETPTLFVLSAKSEQQLKSYAQDMKHWIQAHSELALSDIAFTLQLGREAMDYRLAILANSREVLLQRLAGFVDNQTSTGVYTAQVKKSSLGSQSSGSEVALFEADEDGQSLLHIWFQKKKLTKIAQAWVKGVNIDWMLLYTVGRGLAPLRSEQDPGSAVACELAPQVCTIPTTPILPYRTSLPTYPFARKRHWISASTGGTAPNGGQGRRDSGLPLSVSTPLPTCASPSATAATSPSPMQSIRLPALEQDTQSTTDKANGSGQTPRVGTVEIVLRSVGIIPNASSTAVGVVSCATGLPTGYSADPAQPQSSTIETSPQVAQGTGSAVACGLAPQVYTIPTVAPQLEKELTRSLAQALYMEESDIDVEKPFGEIGLDSVIGVEWIQSLNKQYACHLKASSIYDYPTIRQLAAFLAEAVPKNGGGTQQMPVQSTSSLSLDDMLRQVQQRNLDPEKANQLLQQFL